MKQKGCVKEIERKEKKKKLTVALELVMGDIFDDRIFQSWWVVAVSNDA